MPVQADELAAAHGHHLAGDQFFGLVASPQPVAEENQHIRRIAQVARSFASCRNTPFGQAPALPLLLSEQEY